MQKLGDEVMQRTRTIYQTCPHVSAGHYKHEYTTGCAWPMILKEFEAPSTAYVSTSQIKNTNSPVKNKAPVKKSVVKKDQGI